MPYIPSHARVSEALSTTLFVNFFIFVNFFLIKIKKEVELLSEKSKQFHEISKRRISLRPLSNLHNSSSLMMGQELDINKEVNLKLIINYIIK